MGHRLLLRQTKCPLGDHVPLDLARAGVDRPGARQQEHLVPGAELELTTENSRGITQRVLPTFAVVLGGVAGLRRSLGELDPTRLVDAGRRLELYRELPVEGAIRVRGRLTGVYDKGLGALLVSESEAVDLATGEPLFRLESNAFVRGAGGFGGDRGPSGGRQPLPEREPDAVVTEQTRADQALLYRLSGDRNPLHSDPSFARDAGYPRPILHGLCTYGFTGRALLRTLCGSDPALFRSMEGRFVKPVFPGEALTVRIWADGPEAVFTTQSSSGEVVIDQGRCTFGPAPAL